MIKTLFVSLIFITTTAVSPNDSKVYICGIKGAKRYHYSNSCKGLTNCKHQVYEVTKSTAVSYGLTLCGYED